MMFAVVGFAVSCKGEATVLLCVGRWLWFHSGYFKEGMIIMANNSDGKHTSPEAAEAASKVLRDGRTADDSKKAAASALSQAGAGGKEKNTSNDAASAASDVLQSDDHGRNSKKAAGSALSQADSSDN